MAKDNSNTDLKRARWLIDLGWYARSGRSISTLLQGCLCDSCRKKLDKESGQTSDTKLINQIKECCHKSTGFITGRMPVLESAFRCCVARGNTPVTVEELGRQLGERRGEVSRTSAEILLRLLKNDHYYGFHPAG